MSAPTAFVTCPTCERDFVLPRRTAGGRPKRYCTDKCRLAASNARRRATRSARRRRPADDPAPGDDLNPADDPTPADGLLALAVSLVEAHHDGRTSRQLIHLYEQLHQETLRLAHGLAGPHTSTLDTTALPPGPASALAPRIPTDLGVVPAPPTTACPTTAPMVSAPRSARRLAAALRTLFRDGRAGLRDLARVTRMGEDYVEAVLDGSHSPPWTTIRVIAEELGGDPNELLCLWDQSRRVGPDTPRDCLAAAEALACHLRGLWLAADRPAPARLAHQLPPAVTAAVLGRALVPDRPQAQALTLALDDDPEWTLRHWTSVDYAVLTHLDAPIPAAGLPWNRLPSGEDPTPTP
ncbi:hypothetical protein [Embleya sp. NPDC020630]|uniref:hypothetical protein n=1 Tax=Embleya sp. NPDC020630 TaxID=3363979 RepID=UPI0037B54D20